MEQAQMTILGGGWRTIKAVEFALKRGDISKNRSIFSYF
jgi:hypothetical protein